MKDILVCTNEASFPFSRGDKGKIEKMNWQFFLNLLHTTTGQILVEIDSKSLGEGDAILCK